MIASVAVLALLVTDVKAWGEEARSPTVVMQSSPASPQPVGTQVTFIAVTSGFSGRIDYRFSIRRADGTYRVIRDYDQFAGVKWTPTEAEGSYQFSVTAVERQSKRSIDGGLTYAVTSRIVSGVPVVSNTRNRLVALYSAPVCSSGAVMRVQFWRSGTQQANGFTTPSKTCSGKASMNFYIAGMRASSDYYVQHQLTSNGQTTTGPTLVFHTGALPFPLPQPVVASPVTGNTAIGQAVLIHSFITTANNSSVPAATDLAGNYIWYNTYSAEPNSPATALLRLLPGGNMLVFSHDSHNPDTYANRSQILRELDVAGNILRETNVSRISDQVAALGGKDRLTQFHHDTIRLQNGHTLALLFAERIYPAGTQGSTAPVDILGIYVVDLDEDLRVAWFWCSYDHLDIQRKAVLNETCDTTLPLCPALYLDTVANDWLHGNSLDVTQDGGLLISLRHQDWIIKVDYQNGTGSGNLLWRMGKDGDFSILSTDPYPWFSHQHDAQYESGGSTTMSLFDNGNTRRTVGPNYHSRGMVLNVDENARQVTPVLNADLGYFARALGSAQRLPNGNYNFCGGWIQPDQDVDPSSQSIEVTGAGALDFALNTNATTYRSFRQKDLYSGPAPSH